MYNNTRWMFALLVFLLAVEGTSYGVIFLFKNSGLWGVYPSDDHREASSDFLPSHAARTTTLLAASLILETNSPTEGLFICADSDPLNHHWITWFWLIVICIESVLLCLSVYRGWQTYRAGLGGGLMTTLMKDSVIYFVV